MVLYPNYLYAYRKEGGTISMPELGNLTYTIILVTIHVQIALVLEHWTVFHHAAIWGSIGTTNDHAIVCFQCNLLIEYVR